ncbi:MAG: hypothetical protein HQM08_00240 [Candidatus Riflebacteria bacterium]|nr:hypothetical protein [Candidatus Riflebacteria bacterium]
MPTVVLKIHYRSAFRKLIAFSNNAFYKGQLNVPVLHPTSEIDRQRPLEVIQVNGLYEDRMNKPEADTVVNLLASIWCSQERPVPSIGVVTFNRNQADLIEESLELRAEEDEIFRLAYIRERRRSEFGEDMGFFVKNVENVQGDERDQIIFSTTFGRNKKGTFRRNFGVLGQSGGERRLNVAITRARQKVTLLTSMPLEEISDLVGKVAKPQQPRDFLQLYLAYAIALSGGQHVRSQEILSQVLGERTQTLGNISMATDGLLRSVASFIESMGLTPTSSNDGSAFALDFAIRHERKGTFGIGIECGTQRHPILVTARAREIWPRSVTQKNIPTIHRVSIRGWYHNREAEQNRLRQAIEEALT